MDTLTHAIGIFHCLLIIFGIQCLQSRAESSSSVIFIDSLNHQYLRSVPSDGTTKISSSISAGEIGAAVSVLLGFSPPASLSAASSSKLNEVLIPNPFDRPRRVLLLQVALVEGSQLMLSPQLLGSSRATISKMIQSSDKVCIELPDKDEVAFFSLDSPEFDAYEKVTDEEISHFASWLGGSYVSNDLEPVNGELKLFLPGGVEMKLELSKKSDDKFIRRLVSLVGKIRRAMDMHYSLPGGKNLAGLMTSYFKALEGYGPKGVSEHGMDLFIMAISKILESTQLEFKDHVVGVIILNKAHSSEPEELLDVVGGSLPLARFLEEAKASSNYTKEAEVALVRKTLAWVTGIVLIIATLFGVCLLVNMPLTRDTLLYSNVKLD